jgi:hypothetical protein
MIVLIGRHIWARRLCVLRIGSGGEPLCIVRRPRGRRPLGGLDRRLVDCHDVGVIVVYERENTDNMKILIIKSKIGRCLICGIPAEAAGTRRWQRRRSQTSPSASEGHTPLTREGAGGGRRGDTVRGEALAVATATLGGGGCVCLSYFAVLYYCLYCSNNSSTCALLTPQCVQGSVIIGRTGQTGPLTGSPGSPGWAA